MSNLETIVSISTPMGTGALSVIRCSGKSVPTIIKNFFGKELPPRRANYLDIKKDNKVLDDVVAIYYLGPKSFTGEDMLEIMCHGGPVMYQLIIKEILKIKNCRLAIAGEFSERAFLNDKMSILEAESICALINAKTEEAALAARESLSGKIIQDLFKIDALILQTRIQVEALLDFSEEDIEIDGLKTIESHIKNCKEEILVLIKKLERNKLLFETSKVAVIGKPNTGKSSLINFLTEEDVSIVNKQAGTTRDVVSKIFSLDGLPVTIFDTAGIRETSDTIEKEGKEKALKQATSANIILYLYDVTIGIDNDDIRILKSLKKINKNILIVANKIDLATKDSFSEIKKNNSENLIISIKENINMNKLRSKILEHLKLAISDASSGIYHIKQVKHLKAAYKEINDIEVNLIELEIIAEKLKQTQENISMILDNNDDDRVLSGIFSNFCIGK
ncbi:tRNA uridine-5-carboxymethylaminomethyl(34) synthesis GTPase MnmE [Gammaproteobacteria bacterium]|nr:tRNA uridine-5-carboxymethylaminomethyl(34) synthesis GTPase MnmE [Gammaproteobacteria bacterium]